MAYTPTNWQNREVTKPRTFNIQDNPDGTSTLVPAEGDVVNPGTPLTADKLNNLEQGVVDAHNMIAGIPAPPVTSVNSKTGAVTLNASDVGAETPAGAQAKADAAETNADTALTAHKNATIVHGATADASANRMPIRDPGGQFKVGTPLHPDHVARRADVLAPPFATTTGTGTAYVATFNPAYLELAAGTRITVKFHLANTGAATINVSGLGAKSIRKSNGNTLTAGNIKVNSVMTLVYDGTNFILQGEGGEYGTAVAADVLTGKMIGTDDGLVTGTMPNRTGYVTGQSISRSGTNLRIRPQQGHYPGDTANGVQFSDANWIAANIPEDLSIFGLQGTMVRGKKWATGEGTTPPSGAALLTVTGLTFAPTYVFGFQVIPATNIRLLLFLYIKGKVIPWLNGSVTNYDMDGGVIYRNTDNAGLSQSYTDGATFNPDGFIVNAYNRNTLFRWYAFE